MRNKDPHAPLVMIVVVFTLAFGLFGTVLLFQSEPHTTEQTTEVCSYD